MDFEVNKEWCEGYKDVWKFVKYESLQREASKFFSYTSDSYSEQLYGTHMGHPQSGTYHVIYTQKINMVEGDTYYLIMGGQKAIVLPDAIIKKISGYNQI